MLFGVDGIVEVREFTPEACGIEWRAEMFVVMSSDASGAGYAVDDIWEVTAVATSTTEATASGTKPASDFDGTLAVSGPVTFEATLAGGTWTGSIQDSTGDIATFTTTPVD